MYCPQCGSQNNEQVKFCRTCGTNLGQISQAITGQRTKKKKKSVPLSEVDQKRMTASFGQLFLGVGFFLLAIMMYFSRQTWGLWLLIPAFGIFGKGAGTLLTIAIAYGEAESADEDEAESTAAVTAETPARRTAELPPPAYDTNHFMNNPPSSVTESPTQTFEDKVRIQKQERQ
ncbi:MAG: zinc-ribbon domain-containing protein [Acidobacteria bacterium]|nr:zinc-ribbon domain-containing protein [Acidobacteriota bacterium]